LFPTVGALGGTAAAVVAIFSLIRGVEGSLTRGIDDLTLVVISQHARGEASSTLTTEEISEVSAAPGISLDGTAPLLAGEYVTSIWIDYLEGRIPKHVRLRGIEANALDLHPHVRLLSGRLPARGEPGIVVGSHLLNRFAGLNEGGALRFGRRDWPVLGVLDNDGPFASEIWADRSAISVEFHHPHASVAYVRVASPEGRADFLKSAQRVKGVEVLSEPEVALRRRTDTGMNTHVRVLTLFGLVLALAAIFASINALHSSLVARSRELATLMAIGFKKREILLIALQESLMISLLALAVGLPLALLIENRTFLFDQALFYTVHVEAMGVAIGTTAVILMSVVSGLLAVIQILRMDVLLALRRA
jgi:putative ABC transport system permease protein